MTIWMKNFGLSLKLGAATDLLLENTGIKLQLYTPKDVVNATVCGIIIPGNPL